jgi:hypothetical protein
MLRFMNLLIAPLASGLIFASTANSPDRINR